MFNRLLVITLAVGLGAGCSSPATSPLRSDPVGLVTTPADGATAIRLDAPVTLDFGVIVDRATVEEGFHLVSAAEMAGSCPDPAMAPHPSMEAIMSDPTLLSHMGAVHGTRGTFTWRESGMTCDFRPDSLLQADMLYMLHMNREMLEMMSARGGSMGAGPMTNGGAMVAHFTTTTADGHAGHHP